MRRDGDKARSYAKRHGVPHAYSDADDLINHPEVNVIYVATPPCAARRNYCVRCQRWKTVYVEKPMARAR